MTAFRVRVMATARIAGYVTIDADTEELALAEVEKIDADSIVYQVDDDFYVDGDPVAFVRPEYDGTPETENAEDVEIDLRAEGEPFSWEAVAIVKDLAAYNVTGQSAFIDDLVARAKAACKKGEPDAA